MNNYSLDRQPMPENVKTAIEDERAYQEKKWPSHQHTIAEWLLIIEKLCADARHAWVTKHGDNQALHEVRQIAATSVACLEQCGAPLRGEPFTPIEIPKSRPAKRGEGGGGFMTTDD